jgi:hypothetical protein
MGLADNFDEGRSLQFHASVGEQTFTVRRRGQGTCSCRAYEREGFEANPELVRRLQVLIPADEIRTKRKNHDS